jgi:hypothetical protein
MGPFTVPVAGLNPNTQYFFRAYATNISGTSYSDISGFKTLPIALAGVSEVGWFAQSQPSANGSEGETLQTEAETTPPVPQFVYEKSDQDTDGMVYSVEVSEDSVNWVTAGSGMVETSSFRGVKRMKATLGTYWSVEETAETITVTWDSADPAPKRLFFRVKGSIPKP